MAIIKRAPPPTPVTRKGPRTEERLVEPSEFRGRTTPLRTADSAVMESEPHIEAAAPAAPAAMNAPGIMKMDPTAVLMLDDPTSQRLVVTWHLVPRAIREGVSIYDIASVCSGLAGCTINEAIGRLHALRSMGVINRDGSIDTQAADYLTRVSVGKLVLTSRHNPETMIRSMMDKVSVEEFRAWLSNISPELFRDGAVPEDSDSASRRRDQNTPVRVTQSPVDVGDGLPKLEWDPEPDTATEEPEEGEVMTDEEIEREMAAGEGLRRIN